MFRSRHSSMPVHNSIPLFMLFHLLGTPFPAFLLQADCLSLIFMLSSGSSSAVWVHPSP